MRLQPVVANSLRRLAVRDVALSNGAVIPAGVIIELAQYSVFRNPAWGWEDPDAFKPVSPRTPRSLPAFVLFLAYSTGQNVHVWPEDLI